MIFVLALGKINLCVISHSWIILKGSWMTKAPTSLFHCIIIEMLFVKYLFQSSSLLPLTDASSTISALKANHLWRPQVSGYDVHRLTGTSRWAGSFLFSHSNNNSAIESNYLRICPLPRQWWLIGQNILTFSMPDLARWFWKHKWCLCRWRLRNRQKQCVHWFHQIHQPMSAFFES